MRLALLSLVALLAGPALGGDSATCTSAVCALHRPRATSPRFDPATVVTLKGRVARVVREDHGGWEGVHLELATDAGPLLVALGPAAFVDLYATFATDDEVTVTGARSTQDGRALLLTTTITRGVLALEVRTAAGQPLF
jgi:hypothetical protein